MVVLVGLLVTAGFFLEARKRALDDFRAKFEERAAAHAGMMVKAMDEGMLILKSVGQFCQEGHGARKEFSAFVAPLLRQHRELGSVEWVPRVAEAGRVSYERMAQKQGAVGFRITERGSNGLEAAGPREVYYPLFCFQLPSGEGSATGFDFGSDPILLSALQKARDSGEPAAVDNMRTIAGLDNPSDLFIILPVYQKRQLSSLADRRAALRGFVFGALRTDEILSTFLFTMEPGAFTVELFDLSVDQGEKPLRIWSGPAGRSSPSWRSRLLPPCPPYLLRFFSGKEWGIRISPGQAYMENNYNLFYWLLLPGGLGATLLLALLTLYLKAVLSQRERMVGVVLERTAELREHEQHLERLTRERTKSLSWKSAFLEALTNTSEDGIIVVDSEGKRIFQNQRALELWRVPQDIIDRNDEEAWVRHILSVVRYPVQFDQTVKHLCAHPDENVHDEVEFVDGTVLERYSSPVMGKDGRRYGRVLTFRDITERKRAEEALRRSEATLRSVFAASPVGISLVTGDRVASWTNGGMTAITGYSTGEARDLGPRAAYLSDEEFARVYECVYGEIKQGRVGATDTKWLHKDGRVLDVHISAAAIDPKDLSAGVVFTTVDMTERKRAEEALRESENKFRDLAEKSIVGVYLIQDGLFRYVNSRFAQIHGYAPEELIDRKRVEETVVPEDIQGVQDNIRKRMSGEVDLVRDEFRIVTKQGDIRDVEIYGTHTVYQGRKAIIGTLLDVTERKQTEAMLSWKTAFLEAQVNSSLDGILVIDGQGRHVLQNQRTVDMWKIPGHAINDKDVSLRFSHMKDMAKNDRQFQQKVDYLRRHPNETSRDEIELNDGTVLDTYSCPVLGEDGKYYGRIWTFRDITELRHYWDMLENLSATDGLTDLPNRRRFDDFLNREWRRSMRDQSLLSLILLDVDFFKEFNDHYGHLAGDDCLRQVGRMLREVVRRPGDLAARYGGEEFACVLTDTDSAGAVNLANRIRDRMNESNIPHFFSPVADHVTLSFGVATLIPSKGESPSDLIQLTDKLLYGAKKNGRDQVRTWRQPAKGRRINER
jgi:diguanylate cyclase (GGDEF)-like protein/PAS domain S-box-containing protein